MFEQRLDQIDRIIARIERVQGEIEICFGDMTNRLTRNPAAFAEKVRKASALQQETEIKELQTQIDTFYTDSARPDKFIELVDRYTTFPELTTPMLNEFVEKVIVHEADKSTGKRKQKVEVHLNFIGKFEAPVEEIPLTAEEIEAERIAEERRRKNREKQRLWRERKRQQQAA